MSPHLEAKPVVGKDKEYYNSGCCSSKFVELVQGATTQKITWTRNLSNSEKTDEIIPLTLYQLLKIK